MNKFLKVSICVLSMAAFGLAPVSQAFADNRDRDRGHQSNKKHYKNHSDRRDNRHHNQSRKYDKHNYQYAKHHYKHDRRYNKRHHYGHYNYRHHRGHGGEVALGVLTGGLLFYALTANDRSRDRETVYVKERPVYVQPPQQTWTRPAQPQDTSCLQTREYQTTITVGGQSVPAYGQSCLQPDGSWKLGPAIPAQ